MSPPIDHGYAWITCIGNYSACIKPRFTVIYLYLFVRDDNPRGDGNSIFEIGPKLKVMGIRKFYVQIYFSENIHRVIFYGGLIL